MTRHLVVSALIGALAPLPAFADSVTARLEAGFVVISKADNLWGGGNSSIDSLGAKPKGTTRLYPAPMFDLRYGHDALDNTYYLASTRDEPGGIVAGVRHRMAKGAFDTSLSASFFGKEWENPYLLQRQETDINTFGFKAAWDNINGSDFSLSYRVMVKELDRDLIGEVDPRLRREGTTHRVEANRRLRLADDMTLVPMVAYERGAANGAANQYHSASAALSLVLKQGDVTWTNKVSGDYALYDEKNPVFGDRRQEPGYGLSSVARIEKPFGVEKVSITIGFKHEQTFSTIDFFEKRSETAFAMAGYSF